MSDSVPRWSPEDLPPRPPRASEFIPIVNSDPTWVFDRRAYCPDLLAPYVRRPELGFAELLSHAFPAALGKGWTVDTAGGPHQRTLLCADPWQGFVVSLVPTVIRPIRQYHRPFAVTPPRPTEPCAQAVKLLRWFHHRDAASAARSLLRPTNRRLRNGDFGVRRVRHPEGALGGLQVHIASPAAYDWPARDEAHEAREPRKALSDTQHLVMRTLWVAKTLYESDFPGMDPLRLNPPPA